MSFNSAHWTEKMNSLITKVLTCEGGRFQEMTLFTIKSK